ncbi:UNVERIFIED_CONTAM: hypothetical protein PYX00_001148 [Menopon gallinae]|uniref:methylated diphthine methylhydrolase n=1 Tax=Menopon gallinae TaxID=328185 RepID=A0AAW2ID07_9NEOP
MTTQNIKTLFTCKTPYNADSVEWCPIAPYQNYFVCGTYQQVKDVCNESEPGNKRKGSITLFKVTKEKLEEKFHIETSGILDMKWCTVTLEDNIVLGAANADGEICVFYLIDERLKTETKISLKKGNEDVLILSLDWSKNAHYDMICASDSKGNVILLKFTNGNLQILNEWNAHTLEAWITCFHSFNPQIIYSGGDDAKLNVWDMRSGNPDRVAGSKKHLSGVTVLNCHPCLEHCLASGSYDETIFLWDTRKWKEPQEQITAGGGLWRLKWSPKNDSRYLLAACIYGGFEIVKGLEDYSRVARYLEHESLAYGADWCHIGESEYSTVDQYLIATCSFYDQKLCVSLWDENINIVDDYS